MPASLCILRGFAGGRSNSWLSYTAVSNVYESGTRRATGAGSVTNRVTNRATGTNRHHGNTQSEVGRGGSGAPVSRRCKVVLMIGPERDNFGEFGGLRHGNRTGDPSQAPRCGAKTRNGQKCRAPAMRSPKTGRYTRCRMHGGASTGPQTAEGLERCRKARWLHGRRSADAISTRRKQASANRAVYTELRRLERLLRSSI